MSATQLDLPMPLPAGFVPMPDPRTMARRDNPITSKQAALAAVGLVQPHHRLIRDTLRGRHEGLTVHQMAAYCSLTAHEIGKRMHEMQKLGEARLLLGADGEPITRMAPGQRAARVWLLAKD